MLLTEPPRSPYDLRFHLFGIPVRVHPLFWLVALLLGLSGKAEPADMLMWVGVVFVSIVVHEMGHALAARAHGWEPWITLYGMGGLASYQPSYYSPRSRILITLAGPMAGFLFAVVVIGGLIASGHAVRLEWIPEWPLPALWEPFTSERTNRLVFDLLYVNIYWGLVNLLPIYPLDGGQIARELFSLSGSPAAVRQSLWLSIIMSAGLAVVSLVKWDRQFLAFFFAYFAFMNYQTLKAQDDYGGGFGGYR